jgi:hypothetical protein
MPPTCAGCGENQRHCEAPRAGVHLHMCSTTGGMGSSAGVAWDLERAQESGENPPSFSFGGCLSDQNGPEKAEIDHSNNTIRKAHHHHDSAVLLLAGGRASNSWCARSTARCTASTWPLAMFVRLSADKTKHTQARDGVYSPCTSVKKRGSSPRSVSYTRICYQAPPNKASCNSPPTSTPSYGAILTRVRGQTLRRSERCTQRAMHTRRRTDRENITANVSCPPHPRSRAP